MRFLQLFAKYTRPGGEEGSADRIYHRIKQRYPIERLWIENSEWEAAGAPPRWRQAMLAFRNPDSIKRILAAHRDTKADCWIVHNPYPILSPALYAEAKRRGIPVIQWVHNYRPFSVSGYLWAGHEVAASGLKKNFLPEILAGTWQGSRLRSFVMAAVLWNAHARGWYDGVTRWVMLSAFMQDRFVEAGIPRERVFVVPHSRALTTIADRAADHGYYLFLSNLIEAKGVRTLLSAWERLAANGRAPKLVIAGDGPLRAEVEQCRSRLPSIEFVGWVDGPRKAELIAGCRAVIVPSIWWEPLPTVVFEAFDATKAVIGAASGGILDMVRHEENGYLFPAGDASALADLVARAESAPEKLSALGRNGRRMLAEEFSEALWFKRFEKVVRSLG